MSQELKTLAHEAIDEMWAMRENHSFQPTADIDMVWVVSAPGTVKEAPNDWPYEDVLFDLDLVEEGIRVVKSVTGLRLGKDPKDVTKSDIEDYGPTLFYNGEDEETRDYKYPQNAHLREMMANPNFPLPLSKVIIGRIPEIGTPAQVKELARQLRQNSQRAQKIAVVAGLPHLARVGRYLSHHQELFPKEVEFVEDAVTQAHNELAIAGREARKVVKYYQMGHLARESRFRIDTSRIQRPDVLKELRIKRL